MAKGRSLKYRLDTNIISELRRRADAHPSVLKWISGTSPSDLATSVLVLAEIRRGIEQKRRKDKTQANVFDRWYKSMREDFGNRILPIDERVAQAWVRLNVPDRIDPVDSLIAATAKVHGLVLITRNIRHFARTKVSLINPFDV